MRSEDVIGAAIFDLLFSVCDRHASNVMIDEESRISLIDHDMLTMNDTWRYVIKYHFISHNDDSQSLTKYLSIIK